MCDDLLQMPPYILLDKYGLVHAVKANLSIHIVLSLCHPAQPIMAVITNLSQYSIAWGMAGIVLALSDVIVG